jgi:hypothetical protein
MTVAPLVTEQLARNLIGLRPLCHWAIGEGCRFTEAAGDTARVFHKSPQELIGRGISEIADERLSSRLVPALERVFAGEPQVEEVRLGEPASIYFIAHLPLRGRNGQIFLAAGFAIDPLLAAPAPQPRTSPAQFLHDEVAQSLSAAGLQLDLLRMDLEARVPEIAARTAEIQSLLDEALRRMREFMAGTPP